MWTYDEITPCCTSILYLSHIISKTDTFLEGQEPLHTVLCSISQLIRRMTSLKLNQQKLVSLLLQFHLWWTKPMVDQTVRANCVDPSVTVLERLHNVFIIFIFYFLDIPKSIFLCLYSFCAVSSILADSSSKE